MSSKSTLLLFAVLLLAASLASAATPVAMTTLAMAVTPSPADLSCNPLLAKLGLSTLDPTPTAQATVDTLFCGTCSLDPCKGAPLESICAIEGGMFKRCKNVTLDTCPGGTTVKCTCVAGPPP